MSEFLKNRYFLNEKSPKKNLPKSVKLKNSTTDLAIFRFLIKSPKKEFISHSQLNNKKKINSFGKKIFYSKISKEGIILENSVKLKTNLTHLAKINFAVKSPMKVSFSHLQ
jgi:hypothetical protein